jgi:hypothetical protein
MKNYLRYLLIMILAVSCTGVQAQFKSGYTMGLNLSSMTYKNKGVVLDPEMWAGIHFGGLFEIPVAGNFTLQPAVFFSAKSTGYKIDNDQYSLSPIFIEIPVRAVYSLGSGSFKVCFFTGPYFALGIDGLLIEPQGTTNIRFGSGYNHQMKPFDMGFNFGTGINIHGFFITVQYGMGLVNLAPVRSDNSEMKTRVIGISLCSLFAHKR